MQRWFILDYSTFLKELKRARINLSLSQEAEWEEYFEEEKLKVQSVQLKIDAIDRDIDNLVYELYGLNEEEIKIIENA